MKIAIAGGGVGGMALAIALQSHGHDVAIFEQAAAFGRIGADVNLTPNAVHALDGLGPDLGARLRKTAAQPQYRISRTYDSGAETSRLPMASAAIEKYGVEQLTIHRADLLSALEAALLPGTIRFGSFVTSVAPTPSGAKLEFRDGSSFEADVVIGADGVHSPVRSAIFGEDKPRFTGLVSWRAVVPRRLVPDVPNLDSFTKWWGPTPDRQIVTFPLLRGEEVFIFATNAQEGWTEEGWTLAGDPDEMRARYQDFHEEVRTLLASVTEVTRSALHVREPMAQWSQGAITLLGDAAHPMVPFMAQGACMALEDAVVLSRAINGCATTADIPAALVSYEDARRDRTAAVQRGSLANDWLKQGGNADWVYGYNPWKAALGAPVTR